MAEQDQVFVKCAWRLIPFMVLLYLVSYIDRTNAGFAALTMNRDLGFSPAVFGFGAGIFFIGYALFQVPANLILQLIGAKRWVFCILAVWGLLSASNALVRSPASFYVVRFLLGVAECGFFPGMLLYLTYWFPRAYLARFTAYFMVAVPLSFVVGGPLSGLILGLDGVAGLHGWQWLFLSEGLPAFLLSFAVLKLLPDGPAQAQWLSIGEKKAIAARLAAEDVPGRRDLWRALRDPRVLALGLANFAYQYGLFAILLWLPQIVHAMGFSNRATGFVVALPFLVGTAAVILGGRSSSIRGERIWHVALPWLLGASGFVVASVTQSNLIVLVAITFGVIGFFAPYGALFSLPSSFLRGTAAAGGIALFNGMGNFGGFFGPAIIGMLKQGSGDYSTGMMTIALGLVLGAVIVLAVGRALAPRPAVLIPEPVDA
jgi:ACS family tartrate transporter-like MFS transporter